MDPGDLVEFKEGLFGLDAPRNHGIYLDRIKRKKTYLVVLHTLKGRKEVNREHLKGRTFAARLDPELPEGEMTARLRDLIAQVAEGDVGERVDVSEADVRDRDLWEKVHHDHQEATPEELAATYFDVSVPHRDQVALVRDVLKSCRRRGVGYFERVQGREERWTVLDAGDYGWVKEAIRGLNTLKNKLVQVTEEERDDGPPRKVYTGVPRDEAGLDEEDLEALDVAARVMEDFILHDDWRGEVGLAGTPVHTIDGFDLFGWTRWLALDWTGGDASISGAFAAFLLGMGLRTVDQVVELVARRNVLAHPTFGWEVPGEAHRAAERLPGGIPDDVLAGRRDLRDLDAWTIDPPDAKDFDDAVSVVEHDDGTTTLWVHIADVSHYVEPGGFLDHHARARATSVYLPVKVLPMLPHRLADDLCSLRSDGDRLAMSVEMRFDAQGNRLEASFHESVIRVNANLSYGEVDEAVAAGRDPFAGMEALARRLGANRLGLDLETDERRVRLTPDGVEVELKSATPATRMIERFMVAANEAVAEHLTEAGVPLLYRCHPLPDRAGVAKLNVQMQAMGLDVNVELPQDEDAEDEAKDEGTSILDQLQKGGKLELTMGGGMISGLEDDEGDAEADEAPPPLVKGLAQLEPEERAAWLEPLQEALGEVETLEDPRRREIAYVKVLSAMGRALYTPRNLGHYGLGSACYGHFTSPIRRYPDLVVHRQLRWLLRHGSEDEPREPMPHELEELDELAGHCTDQAVDAERLEWDVVDAAMAVLAHQDRWPGTRSGLVNGFSKGAVFVTVRGDDGHARADGEEGDDGEEADAAGATPHLEARLPTSDLPGGPWSVDEDESMLFRGEDEVPTLANQVDASNWRELVDDGTGEAREVRLRLGDEVRVAVRAVDIVRGRVTLREVGG